ncbi:cytochrome P450 [Rhodobacterales bacterium HKCCE2091]|nr:cytochrome P450 [Rhodobacterales bacterium HKCCE2091]
MNQLTQAATAAPYLFDPASFEPDPHAAFAALRDEYPVIQTGPGQYLALRASDVVALLTDPRTINPEGEAYVAHQGVPEGSAARLLRDILLFDNGPSHRAKRALFAKAFSHGAMHGARSRIRTVAARIMADMPRGESFDFTAAVAARVPSEMIASIFGLPRGEAAWFSARVYSLVRSVAPVYPMDVHDEIETAAAELTDYVERHLRERRAAPRDDLLSTVLARWTERPEISFDSLVIQVITLVVAGTDTTRAGFAMLVALLLRHPEQWDAVKRDAGLIPAAVYEALRYEPPVGSIPRLAVEDIDIGGTVVPAGSVLRLSTLSAMRDPGLFDDPDRFDIARAGVPRLHAVFGLGPHRCLGEMLARIEMEEGLAALIRTAPGIALESAPRLEGYGGIRQASPMTVRFD